MPRLGRSASTPRHAGAPMGNKHKAHRAQVSTKKCNAYLLASKREKNRDRRAARIARGFRPHIQGMNVTDFRRASFRHPAMSE